MAEDGKQYFEEAGKVLERLKEIKKDGQKWQFVAKKGATTLYKKDYPDVCPTPCYLTETKFDMKRVDVVNKIWIMDQKKAQVNDPKVVSWKEVASGPMWKVCSQYNGMGMIIWPRHIVFAQVKIEEVGVTKLIAFSVCHPKAPTNTGTHVEAKVHMSVYEFSDIVENNVHKTMVKRYTQVDPKGMIPVWLVNSYAGNQVDMFNRWHADFKSAATATAAA